jgi:hypothetical protein
MAQTPSATPTPIPALTPDDKIPCSLEGKEATLDVGPVVDVLLDMSIVELALVVDASVTLEGISLSLSCTMTGLAASIPVYTKIVSVLSLKYEMLGETGGVTVDPAVIAVEYMSVVVNHHVLL